MTNILIKNGFVATMDAGRHIYPRGEVLIEDDRIAEAGEKVRALRSPEYTLDASNKVVMPGFVNTHTHLQQYFRGVYELMGDFFETNLPLEGYRREEQMETLGAASCAELISKLLCGTRDVSVPACGKLHRRHVVRPVRIISR